jgi:hypothetical protein
MYLRVPLTSSGGKQLCISRQLIAGSLPLPVRVTGVIRVLLYFVKGVSIGIVPPLVRFLATGIFSKPNLQGGSSRAGYGTIGVGVASDHSDVVILSLSNKTANIIVSYPALAVLLAHFNVGRATLLVFSHSLSPGSKGWWVIYD